MTYTILLEDTWNGQKYVRTGNFDQVFKYVTELDLHVNVIVFEGIIPPETILKMTERKE